MYVIWAVGKDFYGKARAYMSTCSLKTEHGAKRRAKELLAEPYEFGVVACPARSELANLFDQLGERMRAAHGIKTTIVM